MGGPQWLSALHAHGVGRALWPLGHHVISVPFDTSTGKRDCEESEESKESKESKEHIQERQAAPPGADRVNGSKGVSWRGGKMPDFFTDSTWN
jgi:hypothetical protein